MLFPNGQAVVLVNECSCDEPMEVSFLEKARTVVGAIFNGTESVRVAPCEERGNHSVNLEPLGAMDRWIVGFCWHPSGHFLSLTTNGDFGGGETKSNVRILHFDSAAVLATISGATAFGWSPTGRLLLLDLGKGDSGGIAGSSDSRFAVWDAVRLAVRPLEKGEASAEGFSRLMTSISSQAKANATGELIIKDGAIVRHADQAELARLPTGIKDAAWSPTDPARLATVGGINAPNDVRLWALECR